MLAMSELGLYSIARYNTTHDIMGNALVRVQTKENEEWYVKGLVVSESFEAVRLPEELQPHKYRGLILFLAMTGFNFRPSAHTESSNPYEAGTPFYADPKDSAVVYRKGTKALKKEFRAQPA